VRAAFPVFTKSPKDERMAWSRSLFLAASAQRRVCRRIAFVSFAGLLLFAFGFAVPASAGDVPKDEPAFTAYMQNKLQLYSPSPINVVGPLSLSVEISGATVKLPSLSPLHKRCAAAPSKCGHAIDDYVQNVAREILQPPATNSNPTQPLPNPVATAGPSCGPTANPHDTCTPPLIDWQHSPPPTTPRNACQSGQEGVVIVNFTVHADGSVGDASVLVSSDFQRLDDAAVSQIVGRHYFPARKNGIAIDTPPKLMKTTFLFSCSQFGPSAATKEEMNPRARPEATEKPTCWVVDGSHANALDKCTLPHIDLQQSPIVPFHFDPTRGGEIGDAIVDFTVHADGSVSDAAVTQSSGFLTFDAAAVAHIVHRHYIPATKNGTPVDVHMRTAVGFCHSTDCIQPGLFFRDLWNR
jgi:TonB family protein